MEPKASFAQLKAIPARHIPYDSYVRSGGRIYSPPPRNDLGRFHTYTTLAAVERLVDSLSDRDRSILVDVARFRVLTGDHLTRLHFHDLASGSRERTRRRVMARLVEHRLTATLGRTVGGARAGSSGHIFSLGLIGQRALPLLGAAPDAADLARRPRAPWTPGTMFLAHALDISGLYVSLREQERADRMRLAHYSAEPMSWHPDLRGGFIKPDAYVRVQHGDLEDVWWVEVDRATESIPTIKKKLITYFDFARAGGVGPDGIMPRVLITVPHDHRLAAVRDLVGRLPSPAIHLIITVRHDRAADFMINTLRG